MVSGDEEYPQVTEYAILTIEGYCMLNLEYSRKKDPFHYRLLPDGSFEEVQNPDYDPTFLPDHYPHDYLHFEYTTCISCHHFGWCEYDGDADDESEFSPPE